MCIQRHWMSDRIQSELWVTGGLSVERIEEIFVPKFGSTAPPAFTGRFYFDHGSSGGEVSGVKSSKDWTSLTGGRAVAAAGSFCLLRVVAYQRRYFFHSPMEDVKCWKHRSLHES